MDLPDFGRHWRFRNLLDGMGIQEVVALRPPTWKDWEGFGIDVADIEDIVVNPDRTLSYDGRRVLVYIRDQWVRGEDELREYRYHVSECKTLLDMRAHNRFGRYVVTTRTDRHFIVNLFRRGEKEPFETDSERSMEVCKYCLRELSWQGYEDATRAQQQRIWSQFDPEDFLRHYGSRVSVLPTQNEFTAPLNTYPPDWPEISRNYRASVDWTCEGCGLVLKQENIRTWLEVHHIDGNRSNSRERNLKALCLGCHQQEFKHEGMRHSPRFIFFQAWRDEFRHSKPSGQNKERKPNSEDSHV